MTVHVPRCAKCGRFVSEPARVIPIRDSVHPYTCDYAYWCEKCSNANNEGDNND